MSIILIVSKVSCLSFFFKLTYNLKKHIFLQVESWYHSKTPYTIFFLLILSSLYGFQNNHYLDQRVFSKCNKHPPLSEHLRLLRQSWIEPLELLRREKHSYSLHGQHRSPYITRYRFVATWIVTAVLRQYFRRPMLAYCSFLFSPWSAIVNSVSQMLWCCVCHSVRGRKCQPQLIIVYKHFQSISCQLYEKYCSHKLNAAQ